ncbi:glycosyltransferase [Pasteurella sp. PK-2025]|uniref:glycosyltransferase n=2 Tax=Pasteurella TaxID=745 RepID=UPI003C73BF81
MKILFLHKWLVMGGIERILINYLQLLHCVPNLEIELIIAFDTEDNVFHNEIPHNIKTYYIFDKKHFIDYNKLYQNRKKSILSRLKQKIEKFKEKKKCKNRVDEIIHANNYDVIINFSNHFDPYLAFNKIKQPIIRWQHLALNQKSPHYIKEIQWLKKYNRIITICDEMSKQIENEANLPRDKIKRLFNPIHTEKIIEKANLVRKEGLNIDFPYLVQVSRLDKVKRHIDLINIYAELVKQGIKEKLYIIGNGEEYKNLQKEIDKLKLEKRCILLGEIKNPYPYIKHATLFLHTSEREGLPTVLLESLILNTPVVAMDCPTGPKEILNNGKCGALIPLGNLGKFTEKTYEILNSPTIVDKYQNEIKKHIHIFSEEQIRKEFLEILKKLTCK